MAPRFSSSLKSCASRARALSVPVCFLLACSLGCRANCDLVEAELRTKEGQLDELKQQLDRKDCEVESLETELEHLQRRAYKPEPGADTTALTPAPRLKRITLGRMTGGYDEKPDCIGDEALQVLLEPRDCDDQSVKAPGSLHIELYEVNSQGLKTPLSQWDLTTRELRRKWDAPLIGGPSYRVTLPWKSWPSTEKLRVVARFTTPDGFPYEADKDITIRLAERPRRKREHSATPVQNPEPLKMPREEDTSSSSYQRPSLPAGSVVSPAFYQSRFSPAATVPANRPRLAPPTGARRVHEERAD